VVLRFAPLFCPKWRLDLPLYGLSPTNQTNHKTITITHYNPSSTCVPRFIKLHCVSEKNEVSNFLR